MMATLKPTAILPDRIPVPYNAFGTSVFVKPRTHFSCLLPSASALRSSERPIKISNFKSYIQVLPSTFVVKLEDSTVLGAHKKKLGVMVKPLAKPLLLLKFIWLQKDIGIALNQVIPGYGIIPLSRYYFWPRKDAWEELKILLESKPWISERQKIQLLNQATDIINLWQESGGSLS